MRNIIGILVIMLMAGITFGFVEKDGNQNMSTLLSSEEGSSVYKKHCLSCHQTDGSGVPSLYPSLKGNERVVGEKDPLIEVLLLGSKGPFSVDKDKYMGAMAAYKFLSDEDIADVLTYIRTNFSNDASAVSAADVKEVRNSIE